MFTCITLNVMIQKNREYINYGIRKFKGEIHLRNLFLDVMSTAILYIILMLNVNEMYFKKQ